MCWLLCSSGFSRETEPIGCTSRDCFRNWLMRLWRMPSPKSWVGQQVGDPGKTFSLCSKMSSGRISSSSGNVSLFPIKTLYWLDWRRKWQPTQVFFSGKSHGWRSLVGLQFMGSQRVGHNWVTSLHFTSLTDWMRITHIRKDNLYSKSANLNDNLVLKYLFTETSNWVLWLLFWCIAITIVHLYVFVYLYVVIGNKLAKSLMRKKNLSNSEIILTEHLYPGLSHYKEGSKFINFHNLDGTVQRQIDRIQIPVLHCAVLMKRLWHSSDGRKSYGLNHAHRRVWDGFQEETVEPSWRGRGLNQEEKA